MGGKIVQAAMRQQFTHEKISKHFIMPIIIIHILPVCNKYMLALFQQAVHMCGQTRIIQPTTRHQDVIWVDASVQKINRVTRVCAADIGVVWHVGAGARGFQILFRRQKVRNTEIIMTRQVVFIKPIYHLAGIAWLNHIVNQVFAQMRHNFRFRNAVQPFWCTGCPEQFIYPQVCRQGGGFKIRFVAEKVWHTFGFAGTHGARCRRTQVIKQPRRQRVLDKICFTRPRQTITKQQCVFLHLFPQKYAPHMCAGRFVNLPRNCAVYGRGLDALTCSVPFVQSGGYVHG